MRVVEVRRRIDAPPEVVWEVLVDFESYPEWNPFIESIEGVPLPGQRLRVRLTPPGGRRVTVRPTVTAAEENRRLEWEGSLFVPGLFDGRHEFRIEREGEGVRFVHREIFSGIFVHVLLDEGSIRRGFEAMNAALAKRAERLADPNERESPQR